MTITVFGATGQVGLQVIKVALGKSHTVKAFGRNIEPLIDKDLHSDNFVAIKGYVFDANDVKNAIAGSNAVISCLGGGIDGLDKTRSLGIKNIVAQMQKSNLRRIIAIGGVGVLNADDDTLIMDTEDYPEEFKPVALEHLEALHILQNSNLDWTFICPPTIVNKDADGNYATSVNHIPLNNINKVSAGNVAYCMVKCIEQNEFVKDKIGITNL